MSRRHCSICHSTEHTKRKCSNVICPQCEIRGHVKSDCPQLIVPKDGIEEYVIDWTHVEEHDCCGMGGSTKTYRNSKKITGLSEKEAKKILFDIIIEDIIRNNSRSNIDSYDTPKILYRLRDGKFIADIDSEEFQERLEKIINELDHKREIRYLKNKYCSYQYSISRIDKNINDFEQQILDLKGKIEIASSDKKEKEQELKDIDETVSKFNDADKAIWDLD